MDPIRTKDKIFIAATVPLILTAAYFYFWRADAVKHIESLAREEATLVTAQDFPFEKRQAEQALKKAQDELAAERSAPHPKPKVQADANESAATRERNVLNVFRDTGLVLVTGSTANPKSERGRDVLKATGVRPEPICRAYTLTGRYPNLLAALKRFSEKEMAVIPTAITMSSSCRWSLTLWL